MTAPDLWHRRGDHRTHIGRSGNVSKAQCPAKRMRHNWFNFRSGHPILGPREKTGIRTLGVTNFLAKVWIVCALWVYTHGVGTVVELMNHAALIQRQIQLLSLFPSVAIHRVESVVVKLDSGPEEMRIGRHIE